ncbi:MAG: DUF2142 domain-containing protein [Actinobacteria bacterium]|nr:DUF2142 domain-containing protein [Actinomycetota bacterium]
MTSFDEPAPEVIVPPSPQRRSVAVWGIGALLMALFTTWTIGMPVFTSPDEAAHLFKAYGTAHGEWLGDLQPGQSPNIRVFHMPQQMAPPDGPDDGLACYFGYPDRTADCAVGHDGVLASTAAVYPPFWYGVVGGAARITGQSTHQRAYRAASAVLCAALIALAFESARRSRQASLSPLLLIGLTPMAVFLAGTLNPNAFEIAGFVLAWSLVLHLPEPRAATTRAGFVVGLLVAALLLSRFASAVWVALGALVAVTIVGFARLRTLGWRFFAPALGCTAAALAALAAWTAYSGASADDPRTQVDWTTGHVIRETISRMPDMTEAMIGVLGWLDTPLPPIVHILFAALSLTVLIGVVLSRNRRLVVATALVASSLFAVPIAINVISAENAGLIWQGRYSLPMFAALGVIGMIGWRDALDRMPRPVWEQTIRIGACAAFGVAEVISFWQALRRYTVGSDGKIWLSGSLPWQPGITPMALIALNATIVVGLCVVVLRSTRPPAPAG